MNRSEILTAALRRAGWREGNTRLVAQAETELDVIQQEGEDGVVLQNGGTFRPWFLLSTIGTYALSASEDRIPIPTGVFLSEYEQGALWRQYSDEDGVSQWTALDKDDFDRIVAKYGNAEGTPKKYARTGLYWRVRPVPAEDTTIKTLYYRRDDALTAANLENKWTAYASQYLLNQLSYRLCEFYTRDFRAADRFATHVQRAIAALYARHISAEEVNDNTRMGEV